MHQLWLILQWQRYSVLWGNEAKQNNLIGSSFSEDVICRIRAEVGLYGIWEKEFWKLEWSEMRRNSRWIKLCFFLFLSSFFFLFRKNILRKFKQLRKIESKRNSHLHALEERLSNLCPYTYTHIRSYRWIGELQI